MERERLVYIYIHAKSQAKTKCLLVITNTKFYSEKTMPDEQTEKRKRSRGFAVHLLARVEIFFFPMYKYCYIFFSSRKLKSKIALGDKRRKETNKKNTEKRLTRNLKKEDTKKCFFFNRS